MGKKITDLCLSKPVLFPLRTEDLIAVLTFYPTCADPGIFVRGGSRSVWQKKLWQRFFFFFSPQLILQQSNKWSISKKSIIFQGSRGGPTFSRGGGGPTFSKGGGSNCLFPIESHITCDFSGGGGGCQDPLSPPLDPHLPHHFLFLSCKVVCFLNLLHIYSSAFQIRFFHSSNQYELQLYSYCTFDNWWLEC